MKYVRTSVERVIEKPAASKLPSASNQPRTAPDYCRPATMHEPTDSVRALISSTSGILVA
jgi:hypothetical protein